MMPKFTGKYDKNKKPIYEGDTIAFAGENLLPEFIVVIWHDTKVQNGTVVGFFIPDGCEKIAGYFMNENN